MSGRMLVTKAIPYGRTGMLCEGANGQRWFTLNTGTWVRAEGAFEREAVRLRGLKHEFSYSDYETFNKIHGRNIAPTQPQKGDSVQTLDNMTVEQLRDFAARANNAAVAQEEKGRVYIQFPGVFSAWMERSTGRIYCMYVPGGPVRESYWTNGHYSAAEYFRRAVSDPKSPQVAGIKAIAHAILAEHNK